MQLLPSNTDYTGDITLDQQSLLSLSPKAMRGIRGSRIGMIFKNLYECIKPTAYREKQISEALLTHQSLAKTSVKHVYSNYCSKSKSLNQKQNSRPILMNYRVDSDNV